MIAYLPAYQLVSPACFACLGDCLAAGVRSFRAIHSPVCGGIFVRDFCYTVPDVCVMSKVGNANLR